MADLNVDPFFPEQERLIFGPYFDGVSKVFSDPMKVYRRLLFVCNGDINAVITAHKSPDIASSAPATEKLIKAAVDAFELTLIDKETGEGLLERDVIELLDTFFFWLKKKEKPVESTPIPPPSMDRQYLEQLGFPTNSFSLSGLTSPESVLNKLGLPNEPLTMPQPTVQSLKT